jgi:periplasmic protein TonB
MFNTNRSESITMTHDRTARALSAFGALVTALVLVLGPLAPSAQAQDDKVYSLAEVSNPPKLSSSATAARLIQESYPEDLKRRKVGGLVELQFVVDAQGNVVAGSIEVVDATQTTLGEAAKKAVSGFQFEPGKLNGAKVKTKVVLPIVYKAM